jgi:hypothetical protein
MKFLKENWWLIIVIFSIGGYFAKLQINVNSIDNKLDKQEFFNIRSQDSLKEVIRQKEQIIIQQKLKLPHGEISDTSKGGGKE